MAGQSTADVAPIARGLGFGGLLVRVWSSVVSKGVLRCECVVEFSGEEIAVLAIIGNVGWLTRCRGRQFASWEVAF